MPLIKLLRQNRAILRIVINVDLLDLQKQQFQCALLITGLIRLHDCPFICTTYIIRKILPTGLTAHIIGLPQQSKGTDPSLILSEHVGNAQLIAEVRISNRREMILIEQSRLHLRHKCIHAALTQRIDQRLRLLPRTIAADAQAASAGLPGDKDAGRDSQQDCKADADDHPHPASDLLKCPFCRHVRRIFCYWFRGRRVQRQWLPHPVQPVPAVGAGFQVFLHQLHAPTLQRPIHIEGQQFLHHLAVADIVS